MRLITTTATITALGIGALAGTAQAAPTVNAATCSVAADFDDRNADGAARAQVKCLGTAGGEAISRLAGRGWVKLDGMADGCANWDGKMLVSAEVETVTGKPVYLWVSAPARGLGGRLQLSGVGFVETDRRTARTMRNDGNSFNLGSASGAGALRARGGSRRVHGNHALRVCRGAWSGLDLRVAVGTAQL